MGCEINITRLKQKAYEVIQLDETEKYILFIDLKNAYDNVNHKTLFDKIIKLNFPEELVNTINKIYSFAKMKIDLHQTAINVNRGASRKYSFPNAI